MLWTKGHTIFSSYLLIILPSSSTQTKHPVELTARFGLAVLTWSATQSHIYKALEKLEADGLVESQVIPQEGKPNRKQYKITDTGRTELRRWVSTPCLWKPSVRHG